MKIFKYLFIIALISTFVISCSSDDNNDDAGDDFRNTVLYFPLQNGNFWNYDSTYDSIAEVILEGKEYLEVKNSTPNRFQFENKPTVELAEGFFTNALNNGYVKENDGKLSYTGTLNLYTLNENTKVNIEVEDMVFFDENASVNEVIYQVDNGVSNQDFEVVIPGNLTIKYNLKIVQSGQSELKVNGVNYTNVVASIMTLTNVSVIFTSEELGSIETHILEAGNNEILSTTNYFSYEKGLIKSVNEINIPFRTVSDIVEEILGIPMDPDALLAAGAPDLKPVKYRVTQDVKNFSLAE